MVLRIHVTDRDTFKRCRRLFHFDVQLRLATKTSPWNHFSFGTVGHAALAELYRNGTPPVETAERELQKIEEQLGRRVDDGGHNGRDTLLGVLKHYQEAVHPKDVAAGWKILDIETEMCEQVPGTDVFLVGTADIIYEHRGAIWGNDHKFYKDLPNVSRLEMDDQMTAYNWLLSKKYPDRKIGGFYYNVIVKKLPAEPMLLKAGDRFSKDKSVDTTYEIFRQAIEKQGFKESDYSELLAMLKKKGLASFFLRAEIARGRKELAIWEKYLTEECKEIANPETSMYPYPTWDCAYCDFLMPCKMMQEGSDYQHVLDQLYVPKVGRE